MDIPPLKQDIEVELVSKPKIFRSQHSGASDSMSSLHLKQAIATLLFHIWVVKVLDLVFD